MVDAAIQSRTTTVDFASDFIVPVHEHIDTGASEGASAVLTTAHGFLSLGYRDPSQDPLHLGGFDWFRLGSGTAPGDIYSLTASGPNGSIEREYPASAASFGGTLDATTVPPFTGWIERSAPMRLVGLSYHAGGQSAKLYRARLRREGTDIEVLVTSGWLGNATRVEIDLPESVAGFDPAWRQAIEATSAYRLLAYVTDKRLDAHLDLAPATGASTTITGHHRGLL